GDEARIEGAGRARERRADAEGEHLPRRAIDAEGSSRNLVLSDRGERFADRRAHKLVEEQIEKERKARDQIEHVRCIAERDDRQPRQRNVRRWLDAIDAEWALRQ